MHFTHYTLTEPNTTHPYNYYIRILNNTFLVSEGFYKNQILIKGNTLYIYYYFYIDDNKTKIDCDFNVSGYTISDDGIIADDLTEFSIPITLGV